MPTPNMNPHAAMETIGAMFTAMFTSVNDALTQRDMLEAKVAMMEKQAVEKPTPEPVAPEPKAE